MKFHDEYFNSIYNRIIDAYQKGLATNGDDFLTYYRNQEEVSSLLDYIHRNIGNRNVNLESRVNYQQKYYPELFYNSIVDAYENGLISNYEDFLEFIRNREDISNYYVMTLAVIADTIEDVYYDMTSVYNSNKIDYALGVDLDYIGEIVGCPRPQATRSGVMVTFTLSTHAEKTELIPSGTIVSSRKGTVFVTQEDGIIDIGNDSVDVYCLSQGTGSTTRVLSESINKVDSTLELGGGGFSVTNYESSSGGKDAYTDDEYRYLLLNWVRSKIKGSREAFELYFSDFDGLDSYKLIPNWNGSGTLKIVLDPGYPYQLQTAYDEIMEGVAQIDDDITMWSPTKVNISVYIRCNVDIDMINPYSETEKDEIKSRIIDGVKTFVNGDVYNSSGLGIGEDFIPYKLGVFISEYVPEVKSLTFIKSNKINTRVVDSEGNVCVWLSEPISVSDEEIAFVGDDDIIVEME